ncbi:E3 ubiquitin-protein ligase RBBP6-like isoform X1 [Danio rerio]|uniref:E3 ubiquitin-protein ligase RBBP6-like isoform X1 n=1 Tax=Danio rerio TaxID=7955 RepID=A0A8M3B3Y2_DANRE
MSCVHYRFQSRLTHDSLQFEGLNITVGELKRQIMRRERLKFCQLKISKAQTDEEYTDDDALIPKNTSVIIRRVPAAGLKSSNRRFVGHQAGPSAKSSQTGDSSLLSLEQLLKTENLAEAQASEEDKLKAVMYQSSLCYYSSSEAMTLLGLLPPNYVCFHCGIPGHHIRHCPSKGGSSSAPHKRIRRSTGIPRSFLLEVDDPNRKGVMMDGSGKYVIPIIDAEAYAAEKKKRPSFSCQTKPLSSSSSAGAASSVQDARGKRSRSPSSPEMHGDQKRPRH